MMHPYAIDSNERITVAYLFATLSVPIAYLISILTSSQPYDLLWWFEKPSIIGVFCLLYAVFNHWGWRLKCRAVNILVKTPNFSGTWKGHLESSHSEHKDKVICTVTIDQTWSHINIVLETGSSKSRSMVASFLTKEAGGPTLVYEYLNEPKSGATKSMEIHRGSANLTLIGDNLEGQYYTGRGRQTFGSMKLVRT